MECHEPTENESDFRDVQGHDQEEFILAPHSLDLLAKPSTPQELAYNHSLVESEPIFDQLGLKAQHSHDFYPPKSPNSSNKGNLGSPLESVKEFQLLQHFISHLGFWVLIFPALVL